MVQTVLFDLHQGLATDEVTLAQPDGEAQAGGQRVLQGRNVHAVVAVAFFEAQRVEGFITAGLDLTHLA